MKNTFSYSVVILGSFNEKINDYNYKLECGMSFASSYAEAANILEDCYGNDLVIIKDLILYDRSPVILTTPEQIKEYRLNSEGLDYSKDCDIDGNIIIGEKNVENL